MEKLLTEQVEINKQRFISLLRNVTRNGMKTEDLILKLESSDFFTAPASTKFHCSYKGGLCEHSLDVYDNLVKFNEVKELNLDPNSMIICALLHDISKMNFYRLGIKNKKIYSPEGKKWDEMGNFDWVAVQEYEVIPDEERFYFGSHETTSEFMTRTFIPLTYEESIAISHHHMGMGFDSPQDKTGLIMSRYPLALYLHIADLISAFSDEAKN